jgi:hypothetical protein
MPQLIRFSLVALFLLTGSVQALELDAKRIWATEDFPGLSVTQQRAILMDLSKNNGPYGKQAAAYYLPKDHPALDVLNPGMIDLLYGWNAKGSESNCYWTTHFARGVLALPERYMDLPEYTSLLSRYYEPVSKEAQDWRPGDVLRLRRAKGGVDTHSVVFLGTLKGEFFTRLVLSKNGPSDGPYLIMDLWDLQNRIYVGSQVKEAYRKR